jgi:hypothetical protein
MKHSAVLTTIFNERIDGRLFVGWLPFAFLPRHIIRRMKGDPTHIRNKSHHKQSCTKVNWNLLMNSSVIFVEKYENSGKLLTATQQSAIT